jgi:hypothetical protein
MKTVPTTVLRPNNNQTRVSPDSGKTQREPCSRYQLEYEYFSLTMKRVEQISLWVNLKEY